MVSIAPSFAGYNDEEFRMDESSTLKERFLLNWLLNAQIQYDLSYDYGSHKSERVYLVNIKHPKNSILALCVVLKHWWDAQVRYRESLDVYAPYLIAFTSIGLTIYPTLKELA
ncbi:hypothetical protein [Shewanella algae]|uniref:hypothetical protein n=1 Tax=Shewanella algae TaxID=38313 RepID=UPI0012628181|nr:hypothetical protein [Shewanella algae]MBO2687485.1 hypothetical protein [Shewanella algae]NKZ43096.1 hypothetical protein [Shewanella algae]QTE79570.1 hypothetical protein E1N14_008140 [Shewanella algae]